jgi:hypothetical protein
MLGVAPIGVYPIGANSYDEVVIEAIRVSSDIPKDAKEAIKDFIKESFEDLLWKTLNELKDLQPPSELMEYWDFVVDIVKSLINNIL